MAQQEHVEPLTGGIKSGENPFLSQEGDSAGMLNVVFRGNQLTPIVGPKMLSKGKPFDAGASTKGVEGLAALPFPDTTYVVAMANDGTLKRSTISKTNFLTSSPASALTWTDVTPTGYTTTAANDKTLTTAQYKDNYYLFSGVTGTGKNLAVDHTGTVRPHGLTVVSVPPTCFSTQNASAKFPQPVGFYDYWFTEAIKDADGTLVAESGIEENSYTTVQVSTLDRYVTVSIPYTASSRINANATHWFIYRSITKTTADTVAFPNGELIAELPMTGVRVILDGLATTKTCSTTTAPGAPPTSDATSWGSTSLVNTAWATGAGGGFRNYTNSTQNALINSNSGTAAVATYLPDQTPCFSWSPPTTASTVEETISVTLTPSASWPSLPAGKKITGMAVSFDRATTTPYDLYNCKNLNSHTIEIQFQTKTGWTASTLQGQLIKQGLISDTPVTNFSVGGVYDKWGVIDDIASDDFNYANVKVKLTFKIPVGAVDGGAGVGPNCWIVIPRVKLTVYYDVADANGEPYETVTINNQYPVQANTPPPNATCGAVFNDSLVLDDCAKAGRIRWSIPGMPESFPEPYYLDVPTTQNDKITGMWVLNNKLIVATDTTMWRINYLPMADDVLFQKGQVAELIDANSGCVGPLAATVYGGMQGRPELAYIDKSGFNSTDGFTVRNVSPDFNIGPWLNQARPFERKVVLINESEESNIFVFAPYREITGNIPYVAGPTTGATGYTANFQTGILVFNYGPAHMNEKGEFKCSGAQSGLMTTTVSQGGTTYNQFIYPGAACLLRNTPILKAWGTGNMHLMLVGFTANGVYGENDISIPVPTTEAQFGAVGWMMPFRNFLTASPTVAVNTSFGTTQTASITVTRPISLEGIGGEYRTLEVYFGPRIETTSLQAQVRFFNLDQTTNTVSYTAMSPNSLTQKQNLNMFSTAQQYRLVYDVNNPSAANSAPHPHVHLLSFLLIRYDGYGKETR